MSAIPMKKNVLEEMDPFWEGFSHRVCDCVKSSQDAGRHLETPILISLMMVHGNYLQLVIVIDNINGVLTMYQASR